MYVHADATKAWKTDEMIQFIIQLITQIHKVRSFINKM